MNHLFNPFSNAGLIMSSGGGSGYPEVNTFEDLPDANLFPAGIFLVKNSSGIWLLNRKEAGFYKSNGSSWSRLGNWIEAFQDNNFIIYDHLDTTKTAQFLTSDITTLTSRSYTLPNKDGILALMEDIPEIWTNQNSDDTSEFGVVYVGKLSNFSNWKVRKVFGTTPTIQNATVSNNPSITDYAVAWANRLTLNYT